MLYVYIYIYIYIYIHSTCTHTYIRTCIHTRIARIFDRQDPQVRYVCMCVYILDMYVCMHVCMYYVDKYIYTYSSISCNQMFMGIVEFPYLGLFELTFLQHFGFIYRVIFISLLVPLSHIFISFLLVFIIFFSPLFLVIYL